MPKIYVLYHANCKDGDGAHFAAYKKFGENATYYSVQYGQPLPNIEDGSEVYILDFSYPRDVLEALKARVSTLTILDHHKTAEDALRGFPGAVFNMAKSGAVLAWEHFHPDIPVPDLLLSIQDRDLWTWKRPGTREVLNALALIRKDFDAWEKLSKEKIDTDFIEKWSPVSRYEDDYVERKALKFMRGNLYGHSVALFNNTHLGSEVGNKICSNNPDLFCSIGYFIDETGTVILSFRSVGDKDVTPLAKNLKGGGHKNASGARITLQQLGEWLELLHNTTP